MNIDIIWLIIKVLWLLLITVCMVIYIIKLITNKKETTAPVNIKDNSSDVEKIKILMEKDSTQKIDNLLDSLIKNAVDKYMILNVNFDREKYLSTQDQEQFCSYVMGMVMKNMTESVKNTLGLIYDISTEEKLKEFLDIRIKIYVLAIIVNQNKDLI